MIPVALKNEIALRDKNISAKLKEAGIDAILISTNTNIYYSTGRVFGGYVYVTSDGNVSYFVKRPAGFEGENVFYIRKPEQIVDFLEHLPAKLTLELDSITFNEAERLKNAFKDSEIVDGSPVLNAARAVKTAFEIAKIRECGIHHDMTYSRIPKLYREGMTDKELQIELERQLRLDGCLGLFRIHGQSMEIFMGNLISGENADIPSPYDFTMGGAGLDESLPIGCNGTTILPGTTVMVDMNGNFNGYMTDMSRVFYVGHLDDKARKAHELSIAIHHRLVKDAHSGVPAKELYDIALEMVKEAGFEEFFMGHNQKAGYVGHGLGIEVNELPILSPRSKDILQEGNVIAIEPKFVIPHIGAVGIENTYVVKADRLERITNFPEELVELY